MYSDCVGVADIVVVLYGGFYKKQRASFVFIVKPIGCLLFKREGCNQIHRLCFQDMRIREN
jgi:hypothetical protein